MCESGWVVGVWVLAAFVFGAADQYLGSFSAHPLWAEISGLSAPWLVLPFAVGAFQLTSRRAAVVGFVCTFVALFGYMVMTFSPLESAHFTARGVAGFLRGGNFLWFGAGTVTGPLFAWLGFKWRMGRALVAGLATAIAICLEPFARDLYGNAIRSSAVPHIEIATGIAIAALMLLRPILDRRRGIAI